MNSPYTTFAAAKAAFPNTSYVDLPAGDNSGVIGQNWMISANTTYYFEPGVHTLGSGEFAQIIPANNDTFVGAPGAILDGQNQNVYAFTQHATGVTIEFLEIRHFVSPLDQGVVNHDAGTGWRMAHNYMHDNGGAAMILGDNNTAQYNCLDHNAQYGFQIFGDTVTVSYNEISHNDSANVESSNPGCGCSGGMKAWEAKQRRARQQLGARQPERRPVGRHQQRRVRHLEQRDHRQHGRGDHLRDVVQLPHHEQLHRSERLGAGLGERGLPEPGHLHLGVGWRPTGREQLRELRGGEQHAGRQLGWRDLVGKRQPLLRRRRR